jgi:hypothetical protein
MAALNMARMLKRKRLTRATVRPSRDLELRFANPASPIVGKCMKKALAERSAVVGERAGKGPDEVHEAARFGQRLQVSDSFTRSVFRRVGACKWQLPSGMAEKSSERFTINQLCATKTLLIIQPFQVLQQQVTPRNLSRVPQE